MDNQQIILRIIPIDGFDSQEDVAKMSSQLKDDLLLREEIQDVDYLETEDNILGSKGMPLIDWGALLITLAASGGVITTFMNILSTWRENNKDRSISLEIDGDKIEIVGITAEEQKILIDSWLRRHKGFKLLDD